MVLPYFRAPEFRHVSLNLPTLCRPSPVLPVAPPTVQAGYHSPPSVAPTQENTPTESALFLQRERASP